MALYDAFISYSHAKDKPIASALQSVVQRLGKPWYKRRALRIFRDDTSLAASPHLWPSIQQALVDSRYLILLASPGAAQSQWVAKEVATWLEHKSADTILIALTDGVLTWNHAAEDFAWTDASPLPSVLKGKFAAEPRWIDLSAFRDGASARDPKLMELGADFAAAIRGVPKEDLLSQEVRQQRKALTLAWGAVGSLAILLGVAVWQWQIAQTQRQRAENALRAARQTAETLVFDLALDLRNRPGMPVDLVDDILGRVLALQTQLGSTGSTVELFRLEAASHYMLSQSSEAKGDLAAALEAVKRALTILELLAAQHPDQRLVQRDLAVCLNQLADLRRKEQQWAEALDLHRRALAIVEKLAAADRENVNLQRDLWLTTNKIAEVQTITRAFEDALASYRKGLETAQALLQKDPDNPLRISDVAFSHSRIGITLNAMGKPAEALEAHRQALTLRERAAAAVANTAYQRDVFVSLQRVAEVLVTLKQRAEAIDSYRKAVAIMEQLAASDARNVAWQSDLIGVYDALAPLLIESGQLAQAFDLYRRSLASRERRLALLPDERSWQADLASNLLFFGSAFLTAGQTDDAIDLFRKAAATFAKLVAAEPENIARAKQLAGVTINLGDLLAGGKRWAEARDAYEQCRKVREALLARNPADSTARRDLAIALERSGLASSNVEDLAAALASYRAALTIRDGLMEAEPDKVQSKRDYVLTLSLWADALYRLGQKQEGQDGYRKALAIVEKYAAAEPGNATLQLDLAIGLLRVAYYLDEDPVPYQNRARQIAENLDAQGKLTAAQKNFIAGLEKLLAEKPKG